MVVKVIKNVYHQEDVEVIKQYNSQLKNECIQLANFILLSQRKSFGIGKNLLDFPIRLQTKNIDHVPVHYLNMENYCGKDSWLEKYGDVNGASKSKLTKGTNQVLNENSKPWSSYKYQQQVNLLKLEWRKRQQALHKLGLIKKSAQNVPKEIFKHKILQELKSQGSPFTSSEVQEDLTNTKDIDKDVQSRSKKRRKNKNMPSIQQIK